VSAALRRGIALAALLALAGCQRRGEPLPGADVAARVGDRDLRYADFEGYLHENLGEASGALASDVLSSLFDKFLEEEVLRRLAVDRGLVESGAVRAAAAAALLGAERGAAPSAQEVAAYYAAHAADFERPERVRLRQILVEDRATAERVQRELAAGADFAATVRKYTPRGAAPIGSDQGELARDELPPAFADAVFRLKAGEVSAVLAADYGFHVFQVVAHLPSTVLSLADATDEIRRRLEGEGADRRLADLEREGESRYAVAVYVQNLPFAYRGRFAKPPGAGERRAP